MDTIKYIYNNYGKHKFDNRIYGVENMEALDCKN